VAVLNDSAPSRAAHVAVCAPEGASTELVFKAASPARETLERAILSLAAIGVFLPTDVAVCLDLMRAHLTGFEPTAPISVSRLFESFPLARFEARSAARLASALGALIGRRAIVGVPDVRDIVAAASRGHQALWNVVQGRGVPTPHARPAPALRGALGAKLGDVMPRGAR